MTATRLAFNQIAFELRTFRRNRAALMFTFLFPLMFLVIFGLNASGKTELFNGNSIPFVQFFVPGILAYGVITACYTNLAMRVINLRESGVLKRVRGTPLPVLSYLIGQIGASGAIAIILSAITLIAGVLMYHVEIYTSTIPAVLVSLVFGAACFCAMGLAISSIVPNADAAPAIVNFSMFPILFISDIFYSVEDGPQWLGTLASIFPIKHFANSLQVAFDPNTSGSGFSPGNLAVLSIWFVASTVFALRNFRWEGKVNQ